MSHLEDQIKKTFQPGMSMPSEFSQLFSWIEARNCAFERRGAQVGYLYPVAELNESWGDEERQGGTIIEFSAEGNEGLECWFGKEHADAVKRISVFAKTGGDGSMAAFWLDDEGQQQIVHMGSGSGSTLVCVLAQSPLDFLRLLAIGYDEICWNEHFAKPPNELMQDDVFVHPNTAFQNWVTSTFDVEIPRTASEIVKHPSEMGDLTSVDPFCQWVEANAS